MPLFDYISRVQHCFYFQSFQLAFISRQPHSTFIWTTFLKLGRQDKINIKWNWLQPSFHDSLKMGQETVGIFIPASHAVFKLCNIQTCNIQIQVKHNCIAFCRHRQTNTGRSWILFWFDNINNFQCVMCHEDILRCLWSIIVLQQTKEKILKN